MKIRKFYDPAVDTAGGADVIKEIKSLGAQHTEHVNKLSGELKAATIEEAKKLLAESEKKSAEQIAVVRDEYDKRIKELEANEAKAGSNFGPGNNEVKSFETALADQIQEQGDDLHKFLRKEKKSFILDIGDQWRTENEKKAVGDMTVSANYTGGTAFLSARKPGIIANPSRKLHVRDIPELPKGTTDGTRFDYLKENGAGEGAIAPVAETGTKAQVDLDLVEATAPVETIAGWLRISNRMLNNVPGLISFLQARLMEKLLIVEDDQLINGNGTSPNISGITDSGNFTAASGAGTVNVEQLVQAISQLEELERNPDAILLRPSDFWAMSLMKASGSGEYDMPGIVTFANGQLRVAGIPAYRTTAMTVDKFIVGDFAMGAMLLQRSAPRIEFFREDGTNVRENKVTVRIEEDVAFPIFGSDYFIYGDLGDVA